MNKFKKEILDKINTLSFNNVLEKDLILESYILTKEELDSNLLIEDYQKILPNGYLRVELYSYEELVAYIVKSDDDECVYLIGIIKGCELVYTRKVYERKSC